MDLGSHLPVTVQVYHRFQITHTLASIINLLPSSVEITPLTTKRERRLTADVDIHIKDRIATLEVAVFTCYPLIISGHATPISVRQHRMTRKAERGKQNVQVLP